MTPLNHFPATFTEPAAPRHAAAAVVVSPSSPSPSVDGRRLSRYSRSKSSSSSSSSPSLPVAVTLTRTHTVPLRSPRASTTSHHRPGTHPPRAYLPFASLNAFTSIDPRPNSPPSASLATSTIANDSPASNSTSSSSSDHAATRVVVVVVDVVVHPLRVRSTVSLGPVVAPQISIVAPGFTNAGPRPSITVARARALDPMIE